MPRLGCTRFCWDLRCQEHDDKDDAVLLYSEQNLTVISSDKFRITVQEAYKILRPEGRSLGTLAVSYNYLNEKITSMRGWCIPASGNDYAVTDKDAVEISPTKDESDSLISDEKEKAFQIPAPDPGNIIGFEYVIDEHPLILQDIWAFQSNVPVKSSHYSVTLPSGWDIKTAWAHYPEIKPQSSDGSLTQWAVGDVKEIRAEADMPPWQGLAGHMVVTLIPPGGASNSTPTWHDLGEWYIQMTNGRVSASPEMKQEVTSLTATSTSMAIRN